ncbi:MAG: hypothetical protein RL069_2314 [Planctomycetota bacterium]|jgi:hypothetical protein
MDIESFIEWASAWGFNRRGDIECFPKTDKRTAVWLPNDPNDRGGDRYLCGTTDSCIIRQLPKAPSKRLAKPTLDFLRGFVAPGYRNDALNSASHHCAKARIPESEARSLCLRAADLCGFLAEESDKSQSTFSSGYIRPKELAKNAKNPGKIRVFERRGQEANFWVFSQCFSSPDYRILILLHAPAVGCNADFTFQCRTHTAVRRSELRPGRSCRC